MKAITLWQPWASLWLTTRKVHETRCWATKHRGEIAVHAAASPIRHGNISRELAMICEDEFGGHWGMDLPRGCIIGVVNLEDCKLMGQDAVSPINADDYFCGDWSPDRFAWRRGEFLKLAIPLAIRGKQRIWNGPENVLGHGYVFNPAGKV